MTDPVILLGTQSNGETLPVQVDGFGRLVAEGLQGPEGPQGDKGDTGEPGPPGPAGEGVPTPYGEEGSVLTIVDGQPAWAGGTPPIPPDMVWSDYLRVEGEGARFNQSYPPHNFFDGDFTRPCIATGTSPVIAFQPGVNFGTISSLRLWIGGGLATPYKIELDGAVEFKDTDIDPWVSSRAIGKEWSPQSVLKISTVQGGGIDVTAMAIEVNGALLIDSTYYTMRQVDELASRVRQLEAVMSSDIDPS